MIKITITTKAGTTVSLDIPDDGNLDVTQAPEIQRLIESTPELQPVKEEVAQEVIEPQSQPEPEIEHTSETPLDMFQFPCQSGIWTPPMQLTKDFVLAFGAPHVHSEFVKARLWLVANVDKRKTQRGMGRFLNAWLCREAGMKRSSVKAAAAAKTGSLLDNGTENSQGW